MTSYIFQRGESITLALDPVTSAELAAGPNFADNSTSGAAHVPERNCRFCHYHESGTDHHANAQNLNLSAKL